MSFNQGNPSVPTVLNTSNCFVFGNTASGNALSVQQLGAGNVFRFSNAAGLANVMVMNNLGQVGIGTVSPLAPLEVFGSLMVGRANSSLLSALPSGSGGVAIGWNRGGAIQNGATFFGNGQGGGAGGWEFITYNVSGNLGANAAFISSVGGLTLGAYSNVYMAPTGGIICPGNVGIGTATVSAGLQYWGGASSTTTNGAPGTGGVIIGSDATNGSPGDYSPVLHFRQSWYTQGSGSVTTGGIAGYKTAGSGSFGGGLAFLYCGNGATSLSQGMTLTDAGRVGIGTANPGNLLQVAGTTAATISVGGVAGWSNVVQLGNVSYNQYGSVSAYPANRFTILTAGLPGVNDLQNANGGLYVASQGLRLTGQRLTWAATSYESAIEIDGGRSAMGGINNGQIRFYTANAQRAVIDESGNVGIGVASPQAALQVNGDFLIGQGAGSYGYNSLAIQYDGNTNYGSIIGKSVKWDGTNYIVQTDGATPRCCAIQMSFDQGFKFVTTSAGGSSPLTLSPAQFLSNTKVAITLGGNVGIGTASPYAFAGLTIYGGAMSLFDGTNGAFFQTSSGTLYVRQGTGAGGGTTGVYMTAGATGWTANSDSRLKNIIEPISNALSKVELLNPVLYSWKNDETNTPHPGLIAQDVLKVQPECVSTNGEGMYGVGYTELIPLAFSAIKELSAENTALKSQLASMETRLAALESKLAA